METLQSIKGMKDLLPADSAVWQYLESCVTDVFHAYGYQEIRTPILEQTDLFRRGIGEATDVVEKEMYTFDDRDGSAITMRPEGTAGCVRACEQHRLLFDRGNLTQKLWYTGPMFRHERPQKGRLRQFHQFGVEAFGYPGPDIDAELLAMTSRLWRMLGISDFVELRLNSLGSAGSRAAYRAKLIAYFEEYVDVLDDDSRRRLRTNPLRIFDSKVESTRALLNDAPKMTDYMDEESRSEFEKLTQYLDSLGVTYTVDPTLVRGLDYYSKTVFEWVTTKLGSQGTICGGGRYDGLVELLGGKPTSAIGFGLGVERLILLLSELNLIPEEIFQNLDVYVIAAGVSGLESLKLGEELRDSGASLNVQVHNGGGSLKSQMKKADRSGAEFALILGETELENNTVTVKYLREQRDQLTVARDRIATVLV